MAGESVTWEPPETNAKGWYRWALMDTTTKEVLRIEYKSESEVDEDNRMLSKDGKPSRIWIVYANIS